MGSRVNPQRDTRDVFGKRPPIKPPTSMIESSLRMMSPRNAQVNDEVDDDLPNWDNDNQIEHQQLEPPAPTDGLIKLDDGKLTYKRFVLSPTGLEIPDDVAVDEWNDAAGFLFSLDSALAWWIGDLLVCAERNWKYTYDAAAKAYGKEIDTLYHYANTARSVKVWIRNPEISFSHHRLIAHLEEDEQREWLTKAAVGKWTLKQMRDEMSIKRGGNRDSDVVAKFYKSLQNVYKKPFASASPAEKMQMIGLLEQTLERLRSEV